MQGILIVEDHQEVRGALRDYLTARGYLTWVAGDGQEALLTVRHHPPDLILLDVMMPRMNGLEFLRRHRAERPTPVILLTALDTEREKIQGLELGADDYLTKPFSMAELLARIRALLRRSLEFPLENVLRHGDLELDQTTRACRVRGTVTDLTRCEYLLLLAFMRHPGRVYSRLDLLEQLQDDAQGAERTIDVHIRNLRAKLEVDHRQPRWLETVYAVGYRLAEA